MVRERATRPEKKVRELIRYSAEKERRLCFEGYTRVSVTGYIVEEVCARALDKTQDMAVHSITISVVSTITNHK